MFEHPTYIVLELPAMVGDRVRAIRRRYDQRLASLPAEITIAGSSGVGTLAPDQNPDHVFSALEKIAREHPPVFTRFTGISRFATGPVIWLQPVDPAPFCNLQLSLVSTGIRFLAHKFPYTPHCSLCTSDLAPDTLDALLREDFPREAFVLSMLALYRITDGHARLMRRLQLGADPTTHSNRH